MSQNNISAVYVLVNEATSQIKIGASRCLNRRLWSHELGEDFKIQFFVQHPKPFILERFLHDWFARADLIQELSPSREVYKCNLETSLQLLKEYIIQITRLVWFSVNYGGPNKNIVLLKMPTSRTDFERHIWEGQLEIQTDFDGFQKPEYWKEYYLQHKEQIKERCRNYYQNNKQNLLPKMRERYFRLRGVGQVQSDNI